MKMKAYKNYFSLQKREKKCANGVQQSVE